MKKIILGTALVVLIFSACKNDLFTKNDLKLDKFEVITLNNTAPTEVQINIDLEGEKGVVEYTVYHEGAYKTLEGVDADTTNSVSSYIQFPDGIPEEQKHITYSVYYRTQGTYEVKLIVKDGETLSESFTLSSPK